MTMVADPMPLRGLLGGLMIGSAAAVMLLGAGRIAGVSGLAARAVGLADGAPRALAWAFVLGLPLGALAVMGLAGSVMSRIPASFPLLLAAGLLVGVGTRLGSGCTSGHGVCGLSRLSIRSLAATATFIGAGMATVAIVNVLGGAW